VALKDVKKRLVGCEGLITNKPQDYFPPCVLSLNPTVKDKCLIRERVILWMADIRIVKSNKLLPVDLNKLGNENKN